MGVAMAKDYSGAELYTLSEWMYGKYEARMYMGAASGTVSSMFLYRNGSESSGPWVEIDIEVLGKNPSQFQSNIITGSASSKTTSEQLHNVSPAANAGFHTYGIEWTPSYVRWTLDGAEVRKTTGGQVSALTEAQGLRFNLWSSEETSWVGPWSDSNLPIFQFINWVKAYKYTPGQGPDGSDFTLDWTDNFDSFDASRWGKGNWTFDGNRVDLTENNIYAKDGMIVLALTKKGQEMFNGTVPVDNETVQSSSSSLPASSSSSQIQSSSSVPAQSSSSSVQTVSSSSVQTVSSSSQADSTLAIVPVSESSAPFRAEVQNSALLLTVSSSGVVSYEIVSASGKVLMKTSKHYDAGSYLISIADLPSGQYFIKAQLGNKKNTLRFKKL